MNGPARLAASFLLAVLWATSAVQAESNTRATVSTHSTAFEDRDPVEWNGRAPWRYAIHGIDVARFQRPIIYTTIEFYRETGIGRMKGEEFWLRSVARTLDTAYPGQSWSFWQYTGTGIVPGVKGDVDINVFRGSPDKWAAWQSRRRVR